ncbi:Hypothetical protein NTJ_06061 [Nesidiocoris tenuis]|uniref:GHMP kinase N-terminal domain-containing protein n=1 Tax=Nesidiocoris tenuis TaxID=355587 RepID=A0ABN7ALZ0_9HEMI|nr:Hypothetical protein NTJ_06061 [Nesidiocoris tenuis]
MYAYSSFLLRLRFLHFSTVSPPIFGFGKYPAIPTPGLTSSSTLASAACIILQMLLNITGAPQAGRGSGSGPRHFKLYETYMRHKLDWRGGSGADYTGGEKRRFTTSPSRVADQSWLSLQMNTAIEATYNINVVALSRSLSCVVLAPIAISALLVTPCPQVDFLFLLAAFWQPSRGITIPPPYRMAILT